MRKYILILSIVISSWAQGQENYGYINLEDDDFYEFEVFGDSLDAYQVYFTGENHLYATFNTEFQFKLLSYLYQTQNVRHFMFEQSPGVSYIIEKIIIEDETKHLHYLKDMFYTPFYQMVKNLRKFNDTLAMEDKIHIHGIDVERFPYFSVYALDHIVEDKDERVDGGEVFEQIHALATSDFEYGGADVFYSENGTGFGFDFGEVNAWESLKSIIEMAEENKDSLMVELGEDGEIFFAILDGLSTGRDWYVAEKKGDIKSPIIRERFMADEFERVYRKDTESKYYGQFGRCHLHKDQDAGRCYDYYMNSIANRINDVDSSLQNKVLVIPIYYSHSKDFDLGVIRQLRLKEKFLEPDQSYIIDLAYKDGDHPIVGFYDHLPFIIVCNQEEDLYDELAYAWNTTITEYHLGAYYGYRYINKVNKLNNSLESFGSTGFTNKLEAYTIAFDYYEVNFIGNRFAFTWFNPISNNDGFDLKGYVATMGNYMTFGNKYFITSFGFDYGYGKMRLSEETDNTNPNLIQLDNKNVNIYTNDIVILDPNIELRLSLPIISFNFKAGYAFDVSGKYWKLDGKMKEFTKTSFSTPYIQAGLSLNLKIEE